MVLTKSPITLTLSNITQLEREVFGGFVEFDLIKGVDLTFTRYQREPIVWQDATLEKAREVLMNLFALSDSVYKWDYLTGTHVSECNSCEGQEKHKIHLERGIDNTHPWFPENRRTRNEETLKITYTIRKE